MFAWTRPLPHSVANLTRIVTIILAVMLASRVLLQAQDTAVTNPLVSAYLIANGNANTMLAGGKLQITAYGTSEDVSVAPLTDSQGSAVTGWNTSNHAVAKISTLGHATALSLGPVNIEATIGTLSASPCAVTVIAAST